MLVLLVLSSGVLKAQLAGDLCGTTATAIEDDGFDPSTASMADWECIKYINVNVVFLEEDNFTATGNASTSGSLPPDYTGQDFAEDLVKRMNELLTDNIPPNICNGWLYYLDEANAFYNTQDFELPYPEWAALEGPDFSTVLDPGFRFVLNIVGYEPEVVEFDFPDNTPYSTYAIGIGVRPNGAPFGRWDPGTRIAYIKGARNYTGCSLDMAGLTLHEIGHALNLYHNFYRDYCPPPCPDDAQDCTFFDENTNICDIIAMYGSSGGEPISPDGDGDFNSTCNSDYILTSQFGAPGGWWNPDALDDTHACGDCNELWTDSSIENQMSYIACNEPEEIDNNIMNYAMGQPYGHSITPQQIARMRFRIDNSINVVAALSHEGLEVFINDNTFSTVGCKQVVSPCTIAEGVELTAISGINIDWDSPSFTWSTGENTQTITAFTAGTYTVTVSNSAGCTGEQSIEIIATPVIDEDLSFVENCVGETSLLNVPFNENYTYLWSTGATTNEIEVIDAATYSVTISNQGCDAVKTFDFSVISPQIPNLGEDISICADQLPIILDAGISLDVNTTITWYEVSPTEDIAIGTGLAQTTVNEAGTYKATVITNGICTETDEIVVEALPLPLTPLISTIPDPCTLGTAQLMLSSTTNDCSYEWWLDGTLISSLPEPIINQAGNYTLIISNTTTGCQQTSSITINQDNFISIDYPSGYTLTADETWNVAELRILGTVTVPSGTTLTINSTDVRFMDQNSMLIVQRGGTLRVNGGAILQGNPCVPSLWRGVLAEGNGYAEQFAVGDMVNHGLVVLNDCTIRDAYVGVQLGRYADLNQQIPSDGNLFGGGKIIADNTQFINNSIGVLLNPYLATSSSNINAGCRFAIENPFLGDHHFPDIGYVGVMSLLRHGTTVMGSTFENAAPDNTFSAETVDDGSGNIDGVGRHGIGIVSINSQLRVGSGAASTANTFIRLAKGIDTYAQKSLLSSMHIRGNSFINNRRGITLNGNAMSEITDNTFTQLKSNDYAVFAMVTEGIAIINNQLESNQAITAGSNSPFGIVVRNTGKPGALINNNTFNGLDDACPDPAGACVFRYLAAVQVEGGDNPNVLVDCNGFNAASLYDLRVMDSQNFQDQGECNPFATDLNPTANTWHTLIPDQDNYSIFYSNDTESFEVTYMLGHAPINYSSNVFVFPCGNDDNPCTLFGNGGGSGSGDLSGRIASLQNSMDNAISQKEYEIFYSELMRTYLRNNMYAEAKTKTIARGDVTGDKTMVATYVDERDMEAANNKLASIPQDSQENIDFYNFFSNYISQLLSSEGPSTGKTMEAHLAAIHQEGSQTEHISTHAAYAQSSLASMYLHTYLRTPAEPLSAEQEANSNYGIQGGILQVSPNPSSGVLAITINDFNSKHTYQLAIYNSAGRLISSVSLNNTTSSIDLSNNLSGIYFAQLSLNGQIIDNAKIVLIK